MGLDKSKISRLRMSTPREIRETLAKVNRMMLLGEIEPKVASTFTYVTNSILSSIRLDEQEKKIKELQAFVDKIKAGEVDC